MPSAPHMLPTPIADWRRSRAEVPPRRRARPGAAHGARRAACRCTSSITFCCGSTRRSRSACTRSRRGSSAASSAGCRCCCWRSSPPARSPSAVTRRATSRRSICRPARASIVREHQFLAATGGVQYDYSRIKGFANILNGGGFFVDQFFAGDEEGVVWIHGYGNVFEKTLDAGESIDIEPGGWVYRDHSVADEPAGRRLQDRPVRRRRGQPRVQPLHRSRPRRPAERLLRAADARGLQLDEFGQQQRRDDGHGRQPARQLAVCEASSDEHRQPTAP